MPTARAAVRTGPRIVGPGMMSSTADAATKASQGSMGGMGQSYAAQTRSTKRATASFTT